MSIPYEEWRKKIGPANIEELLKKAYQLLQEWNYLEHSQAEDIEKQLSGLYIKDDPCWEECLPGATLNFCNWGI